MWSASHPENFKHFVLSLVPFVLSAKNDNVHCISRGSHWFLSVHRIRPVLLLCRHKEIRMVPRTPAHAYSVLLLTGSALSACTQMHNMMNPEQRCTICSFIFTDCERLHANRDKFPQMTWFPASEAYVELPQVSQIVSIGKLSLQSSVSLLISPAEISVVPSCQSICAQGGIGKPIICYYLIHACNGV